MDKPPSIPGAGSVLLVFLALLGGGTGALGQKWENVQGTEERHGRKGKEQGLESGEVEKMRAQQRARNARKIGPEPVLFPSGGGSAARHAD